MNDAIVNQAQRLSLMQAILLGSLAICFLLDPFRLPPLLMAPCAAQDPSIDWDLARQLRQRQRAGEALTAQEQVYLNQAIKLRENANPTPQRDPQVFRPVVSETASPITELRGSETAYAAVRMPPGQGPFPAVIFLHGGLGQNSMLQLKKVISDQPTQARFLAWGYVTVNATRRAIHHDPLDRGVVSDTLALIESVRQLPEVDPHSIVLYGGSGGGTLALEVASVSDKVAAIVAGEPATIIYMGMFNGSHIDRDASGQVIGDRRDEVMSADPRELYTAELKQHTRDKIQGIHCPILILHGDQHPLHKFNVDLFVPELKALGKQVTLRIYPGENHGFYWGRSSHPAMPLKANRDADAFFRKSIKVQPQAIDERWVARVPAT